MSATEVPPAVTYEVCAHHINLLDVGPDTPVALPAGWQPLQAVRQGEDLVLLLYRQGLV